MPEGTENTPIVEQSLVRGVEQTHNFDLQGQITGTPTNQPAAIDWSKVDPNSIPTDVIKKHPEYTVVLKETIERRQTIKQLKDQLNGTEEQPAQAPVVPKDKPTGENDRISRLENLIESLATTIQTQTVTSVRERVAAEFKLDLKDEVTNRLLRGSNEQELTASAKDILALRQTTTTSPGNPGGYKSNESLKQRVMAGIKGGQEATSVFSPEVQSDMGGGVLNTSKS